MTDELYMTGAAADEVWPLVRDFHYSRRMAGLVRHCFAWRRGGGLFGDFGDPRAAAIYSQPVSKNFPDDALELSRLVRADGFVRPLSEFLAWSLRWLRANTGAPFVLSYADTTHGHHGGIYQATGFVYVGATPRQQIGFASPDGSFIHGRNCNSRFGTRSIDAIARIRPDWSPVWGAAKHLYVFPLRQRRAVLLRKRGWSSRPYPKPDNAACLSDAPPPGGVSREHTPEAAP